ncbi:MAG: hypothetical protein OIF50_08240 [Flavobacteriaceae bacterium]|nr:hypothetical protein [Flavobacteriaceae bacterium]
MSTEFFSKVVHPSNYTKMEEGVRKEGKPKDKEQVFAMLDAFTKQTKLQNVLQ